MNEQATVGRAAFRRAIAHLEKLIERHAAPGRQRRLPTLAAMAAEAGVAKGTMVRAVRAVTASHALDVRPGRGIHLGTGSRNRTVHDAPSSRRTTESAAAALRRDILLGVHPAGQALPKTTSLAGRYGVCGRTICHVLRALLAERLVVRHKKRYLAPMAASCARNSCIILVSEGAETPLGLYAIPRTMDYLRILENECSQSNVRIEHVHFNSGDRCFYRAQRRIAASAIVKNAPLGIMVWTMGMHDAQSITGMVSRLALFDLPLSLLEESGHITPLPARLAMNSRLKAVCSACTEEPGRAVGRYLLELGHRHVGYISPFHADEWSVPRLRGLTRVFAEAGLEDAVHPYTSQELLFPTQYPDLHVREVERAKELLVHYAANMNAGDVVRSAVHSLRNHVAAAMIAGSFDRIALPLFDAALAKRKLTAWVAAGDSSALAALSYLKKRRIAVPDDISVVGFDNTTDACVYALTSYDFNGRAIMRILLNHILDGAPSGRSRNGTVVEEIPGYIVQRGSSRKIS